MTPADREEAMDRAMRLREAKVSYTAIAAVMAEYHGIYYQWSWWRDKLIARGAPKMAIRGRHASRGA